MGRRSLNVRQKASLCRRTRAFTLAELAVYLTIISAVMGSLPQVAALCVSAYDAMIDGHSSLDRTARVFAILQAPLDMCGYGMPKEPDEYRAAFYMNDLSPFNWPGPISVTESLIDINVNRANSHCRIVYAVPSGVMTSGVCDASGAAFEIRTYTSPKLLEPIGSKEPNSVKNWLLFGASTPKPAPAWLYSTPSFSGDSYTLVLRRIDTGGTVRLAAGDEICYLRAMECMTRPYDAGAHKDDFMFYTNDRAGSGWQPRVPGVVDARFEADAENGVLRVWLLVRGDRRYAEKISAGTPDGWPDEYAADIPDRMRHYRLYAYSRTFRLKNF